MSVNRGDTGPTAYAPVFGATLVESIGKIDRRGVMTGTRGVGTIKSIESPK